MEIQIRLNKSIESTWWLANVFNNENLSSYIIFSNKEKGNSSATIQLVTNDYHSPICVAWDQIVPNPNITKRCNVGYTGPNCTKTMNTAFYA